MRQLWALLALLPILLVSRCAGPAEPIGNPNALVDAIADDVWQFALEREIYLRSRSNSL